MSQIFFNSNNSPGSSVNTLSAEGGPATPPNGFNFNFAGSIAGGSSANGALTFSIPANGEMNATVNVDNDTIFINASNDLQVRKSNIWQTIAVGQTAVIGVTYVSIAGGAITMTLPALGTTNLGDSFTVYQAGGGGGTFTIAQANGQQIQFGNMITSAGAGSKLTSQQVGDFVTICSNQGGSEWLCMPYNGNFIVA